MRALEALHLTLKMLKSVRSPRRGELRAAAELLAPFWARERFSVHRRALTVPLEGPRIDLL